MAFRVLLEDGNILLLEDGGHFLLEDSPPGNTGTITQLLSVFVQSGTGTFLSSEAGFVPGTLIWVPPTLDVVYEVEETGVVWEP